MLIYRKVIDLTYSIKILWLAMYDNWDARTVLFWCIRLHIICDLIGFLFGVLRREMEHHLFVALVTDKQLIIFNRSLVIIINVFRFMVRRVLSWWSRWLMLSSLPKMIVLSILEVVSPVVCFSPYTLILKFLIFLYYGYNLRTYVMQWMVSTKPIYVIDSNLDWLAIYFWWNQGY